MRKIYPIFVLMLLVTASTVWPKRAMTVEDLWAMKRIGNMALSPDGKWIAYAVTAYDLEKNSSNCDLWIIPSFGGQPRQLTFHEKYDGNPQWRPDGSGLAFLSSRDGSKQIYFLSLSGGDAVKMTNFPVDVEDFIYSPDGSHMAFHAIVHAQAPSLQESAKMDTETEQSPAKAYISDHLFYRSFNQWRENKRNHLFICTADGKDVIDITPGEYDSPPLDLNGARDFCFSPDGKEIAFVSNHDPMPAASTNNDIFIVPVHGGEAMCITSDNKAVDNQPLYSPDGTWLAYRTMKRPGFEADQYELCLYKRDTRSREILTTDFDLDVNEFCWSPDGKKMYFTSAQAGRSIISSIDISTRKITPVVTNAVNSSPVLSPDGKSLYFARQTVASPIEIFQTGTTGQALKQLTFINKNVLDELELNPLEDFWFTSFDGHQVHGLILKPPFFDPAAKYPYIFLIHGGPQGEWDDSFHYRWNASMFAAPGYVVIMINFRGSKGYGQAWCDAVSTDWGGGPYQDLMAGLDYALANFNYIDPQKGAAAGASYGGFMINWIATHTGRFKALVSHAGVFDQRSMYGSTEELWFPEWEFNGTPYENPDMYAKWSPTFYVQNFGTFKTPTLVIHGGNDFRVPVTQGMQMFTALQRMGVPSRLIVFPDETHFVSKPQNSKLWWSEVFAWIKKWIQQ
jgi:dipeptidyl aminopeptidase/acylaminoacyl peptidase